MVWTWAFGALVTRLWRRWLAACLVGCPAAWLVRPGAGLVVPAGAARCLPRAGDGLLARRLAARLLPRRECTCTPHHWPPLANLHQCSAKPDPNPNPNPRKTVITF